VLVAAEDTARHKPEPDVFLEAARRLGVSHETCTVYEDTDPDIEAARRAGMRWVDIRVVGRRRGKPMTKQDHMPTRRTFLSSSVAMLASAAIWHTDSAKATASPPSTPAEPIIDVHQHLPFQGRTGAELLRHQEMMGVTHTVLLPAGSPVIRPSTNMGQWNGLRVGVDPNPTAYEFARQHPGKVWFFANEVPDLPTAREEVEKYLKKGAIGIGELKFSVDCDSVHIAKLAELAQAYNVPMLLHFSREGFNRDILRFYKVLEKFPKVNFIGHARSFWANIDKNCDQAIDYPTGPVTPGGVTDRYLSDYANMWGDISAGSGHNSLVRDEGHARWFLDKHQNKIVFGSDCGDKDTVNNCDGAPILAALRKLAPSQAALRKILYHNAKALLRI